MSQSAANWSPGEIPCQQGKEQGILKKFGSPVENRPRNRREISGLSGNSLRLRTGNYFAQTGNRERENAQNRELEWSILYCLNQRMRRNMRLVEDKSHSNHHGNRLFQQPANVN